MGYIYRNIETIVNKAARMFSAILITGARQVGKTTLLKHMKSDIPYLTLDDPISMMKNVSESLAGRIGIINLLGLSLREIKGDAFNESFVPTEEYFMKRKTTAKQAGYRDIWEIIHKGSMPAIYFEEMDWQMFYAAYTRTYIERDVGALAQVGDELKFIKKLI